MKNRKLKGHCPNTNNNTALKNKVKKEMVRAMDSGLTSSMVSNAKSTERCGHSINLDDYLLNDQTSRPPTRPYSRTSNIFKDSIPVVKIAPPVEESKLSA